MNSKIINSFWKLGLTILLSPFLLGQGIGKEAIAKMEFVPVGKETKWRGQPAIAITRNALLIAWCEGTKPYSVDTEIWLARWENGSWNSIKRVATGYNESSSLRLPCASPVLFEDYNNRLWLFYQVGEREGKTEAYARVSLDGGYTWQKLIKLPSSIHGPTDNRPIQVEDGTIICAASALEGGWRVRIEWAKDPEDIWFSTGYINSVFSLPAAGAAILQHDSNTFQLFAGTKNGRVATAWSKKGWRSWHKMERTVLPNPGSSVAVERLIDHRILLVHNHTILIPNRMDIAVSPDGQSWRIGCEIEAVTDGLLLDPDIIEAPNRMVHVVYSWKGQAIRHVIIDPARLASEPVHLK